MKTVLLLAGSALRENRWPILILLGWTLASPAMFGAFGGEAVAPDDILFYLRQQAIYIVFFGAFLVSVAMHNERRSRRILLVLSKAVSRGQYLLGFVLSAVAVSLIMALATATGLEWLKRGASSSSVWLFMLAVVVESGLVAALDVFFVTFLNPYVATAATAVVVAVPEVFNAQAWATWLPGAPLLTNLASFELQKSWRLDWAAMLFALVQAAALCWLASFVFSRRDIVADGE